MPIHIDVRVNDRPIKSLHIGRESGGTDADDLNTYVIMETAFGDIPLRWDYTTRFQHRYGDGVDVCIRKGLEALTEEPAP